MQAQSNDLAVTSNSGRNVNASSPALDTLSLLLFSAAVEDPDTAFVIFNSQLELVHVTGQAERLLNLDLETPLERSTVLHLLNRSKLDPDSLEIARRNIAEYLDDAPPIPALLHDRQETRSVRMRLRTLANGYRVATFDAVSEEIRKESQASEFALRDSLTGLASRAFFENTLKHLLSGSSPDPVTIFLVDLDRFKAVNDTLGHPAGDTLLRLVAERLKAAVRKDDIVSRLGGDEFAILLHPAPNMEETIAIACRILDLVQRTYLIEGQLVNIGTSLGISRAPEHGIDASTLFKNADLALYESKSSGRGQYSMFEERMERRAQARRTSELELRRALALRQLELFYQPQVETTTGQLVGFEALIRWRHPKRGMIPPCDFLPIAEEIGIIVPIGDWVLRTACREAVNWPEHITIAVNVSPLQFDKGNFTESVKRALASSGLPGERLEIEITEGIMLRNDEATLKTLHEIRAMNVKIAMDDFGTGYASLSQLAKFPFDKIKIDRSLAGFDGDNPKQRAIVRAITALGQSLGVTTLAEGVEDAYQVTRLQNDGCTSLQGYFFSRPVPTTELPDIFKKFC